MINKTTESSLDSFDIIKNLKEKKKKLKKNIKKIYIKLEKKHLKQKDYIKLI